MRWRLSSGRLRNWSILRKFEAWKKVQKVRREKNKKAVEEFKYMMESLRQMGTAGAQMLLLMLGEKEMHMST